MSKNAVTELKPTDLWTRFYEITQVPRPSKKEGKIRAHMRQLLKKLKTEFKEDAAGNIVAFVPATSGYENAPTVVIQGHMDMVCEKNKDKVHDFENDPLNVSIKDGWVIADRTTLGSDNGIGLAAGLALITDKEAIHGPLELLMTVDEETGLTGANNLEKGFIKGKTLLNLDSEEDGAFYVGCAGGVDTVAAFDITTEAKIPGSSTYELMVSGLKGGHSGLDIILGRGNAIKILGRVLNAIDNYDFRIANIEGGSLRNAIPREAEAIIVMKESDFVKAEKEIKEFQVSIQNELHSVDSGVKITFNKSSAKLNQVFTKQFSDKIKNVLLGLPHGVIAMSQDIPGLVETSTNLATIKMVDGKLRIATSQRSSVESAKKYIANNVTAIFKLADGEVELSDGYPGWKPDMNSRILKISKKVFNDLFGKEPEIKAIHAGLECGILEGKNPGMDMISFGPTIQNAHSPDERVNIETVQKFYDLVKGILKEIATS
jgi:dipeptidase D